MVRKYVRKTTGSICEDSMNDAIQSVLQGMSTRRAAELHDVNRSTLVLRLKKSKRNNDAEDSGNESPLPEEEAPPEKFSSKHSVHQVFTVEQEEELVKYLHKCCQMNYGLTRKQVRVLGYDYAKLVGSKRVPPTWEENQMAGVDWLDGFMKRHSQSLSLRKPENTSLARASAFNKERVGEFYDKLKEVLEKHKFTPRQIYNLDESGVTTVMKPTKIVAPKGTKQVGVAASGERGELTTVVGIICAAGTFVPPVYIYPRIRNIQDYIDGGPVSALALGNKNGWMTSEFFFKVLHHIKDFTSCSVDNKILLIVDNHKSHINISNLEYCKSNGIIGLTFPPHCSHKLQPLDVAIFGPFKNYCAALFSDYLSSNPGRTITLRHIARLTKSPFMRSFTPANIISAFEKTGISPYCASKFTDLDFLPSEVTDRAMNDNINSAQEAEPRSDACNLDRNVELRAPDKPASDINLSPPTSMETQPLYQPQPSCSKKVKKTPEIIRPFPKRDQTLVKQSTRKTKGSTIYTDSPEMKRLKEEGKVNPRASKVKRMINFPNQPGQESSEDSEDSGLNEEDSQEEEIQFLLDTDTVESGDFLLVQFVTKRTMVHYIGRVNGFDGPTEYDVLFLRRRGGSYTFHFPNFQDRATVDRTDVIAKLPVTRSSRNRFTFNYNFNRFNVR